MTRDGSLRVDIGNSIDRVGAKARTGERSPELSRRETPAAAPEVARSGVGARFEARGGAFVYAVHMSPRPATADRILRAARNLFEREGATGVSMRRVAAAVGLSPMAIYRHFPNREALLKRIGDDSFDAIVRHWD